MLKKNLKRKRDVALQQNACAPSYLLVIFFKQKRQEFRTGKSRFITIAVEDVHKACVYTSRYVID